MGSLQWLQLRNGLARTGRNWTRIITCTRSPTTKNFTSDARELLRGPRASIFTTQTTTRSWMECRVSGASTPATAARNWSMLPLSRCRNYRTTTVSSSAHIRRLLSCRPCCRRSASRSSIVFSSPGRALNQMTPSCAWCARTGT